MTQNQINYQKNLETTRSNLAKEAETHRANVASETLAARRDAETVRSNLARELETNRSNTAKELETARSNRANEGLKHESNVLGYDASIYGADQSYNSRTDTAYINKYGISPKHVGQISSAINETLVTLTGAPKSVGNVPGRTTSSVKSAFNRR